MSQLARRLTLPDAVAIGVASMVGAGVFAVWGPAARAAGSWMLVGLALAALVAWANATSSAQLAAQYPSAGGTYVYGRERLGSWPGYLAGWSFVVGKTASAAAMAMVFSAYWAPQGWAKPIAVGIIWVLCGINILGATRTATAAKVLVTFALVGILAALATGWLTRAPAATSAWVDASPYGVLQSAGLLFFAFAGYARIATMGEEVIDPGRTIRRAILTALTCTLVLYVVIGVTLLARVGVPALVDHPAPLTLLVGDHAVARVVLVVGAAAASAGALLGLLSGIGRTWLAMARTGDLPRWFDHTGARYATPHRIELVLAALLTLVVLVADLRGAIGFSSFGVLLYYLVANCAAWTQDAAHRQYHRAWQVVGAALCVVLVVTLPIGSVLGGLVVLAVGALWRLLAVRRPAAEEVAR
ncbi:APC family permease [uncultured Tessaracoccus sp.]|uniref:APC family permease n=1 Tax=uncultured Tessaracoccus sp. TaxID=905023 RepID=UPI0025D61C63|nr:APC family permease [uncultured Tessaracoccus sp.]